MSAAEEHVEGSPSADSRASASRVPLPSTPQRIQNDPYAYNTSTRTFLATPAQPSPHAYSGIRPPSSASALPSVLPQWTPQRHFVSMGPYSGSQTKASGPPTDRLTPLDMILRSTPASNGSWSAAHPYTSHTPVRLPPVPASPHYSETPPSTMWFRPYVRSCATPMHNTQTQHVPAPPRVIRVSQSAGHYRCCAPSVDHVPVLHPPTPAAFGELLGEQQGVVVTTSDDHSVASGGPPLSQHTTTHEEPPSQRTFPSSRPVGTRTVPSTSPVPTIPHPFLSHSHSTVMMTTGVTNTTSETRDLPTRQPTHPPSLPPPQNPTAILEEFQDLQSVLHTKPWALRGFELSRLPLHYDEHETNARCTKRRDQINKGKQTSGYQAYVHETRRSQRRLGDPRHPVTPRPSYRQSCRSFKKSLQQWRRTLHLWDESPPTVPVHHHTPSPTECQSVNDTSCHVPTSERPFYTLAEYGLQEDSESEPRDSVHNGTSVTRCRHQPIGPSAEPTTNNARAAPTLLPMQLRTLVERARHTPPPDDWQP